MEQQLKFKNMQAMIANTPLLGIRYRYKGAERVIYAKAEYFNLTGSIKDRVAYHILKRAYETEQIRPGDCIAEATSGNTGIAFSALGSYLGHEVIIYMPDWMSKERISLMESYGATVRLVSKEEGGFLGSIEMTEMLGKKAGVFLPRQFSNEWNTGTHDSSTGQEILTQLEKKGLCPDAVVAGVGTGGTVMGLGRSFRRVNPICKVYPLEPSNSPTLSTGYKVGQHRIYGISDEFIPDLVKLDQLDEVVSVSDGDAINMARKLSKQLGLGVGVSSGANFLGCVIAQNQLGENAVAVTVFADDNKKYLSTDYSREQQAQQGDLAPEIELLDVEAWR